VLAIRQEEFDELKNFIYKNYGIDLSKKKHLVEGRLGNAIIAKGYESFGQYFNHVYEDKTGNELSHLLNRITTNHTYFMRERSHFDFYKETILPYLGNTVKNQNLGIWSAGCSSGEEAYTLAMLTDDCFSLKPQWDTRILATDLSDRVLDIAQKGIYPASSVETLPIQYKEKYLIKCDEGYQFIDRIKHNILFHKFNLMDSFHFKRKFHVIFCRNVMIYFDKKTKLELVKKFYEATEDGGYLIIGHSEYLEKDSLAYQYVMPAVYRKG